MDDFEELLTVLAGECILSGINRNDLVKAFRLAASQYENREHSKAIEKEIAFLRVGNDLKESMFHE